MTTIVGPAGLSKKNAPNNPKIIDREPMRLAIKAIFSGVFASLLAAAGGMISNEVISKTPTIFIATAIVKATNTTKIRLDCFAVKQYTQHSNRMATYSKQF